jgi:hypothetical protein
MDEKKLAFILIGLLGIGCIGVLFIVVPWLMGRGFVNWKQNMVDDALIFGVIGTIVYGLYVGTKSHK